MFWGRGGALIPAGVQWRFPGGGDAQTVPLRNWPDEDRAGNSMDKGSEAQRQFRVGRDLTPSGQKCLCHKGVLLEVPALHLDVSKTAFFPRDLNIGNYFKILSVKYTSF